MKNNDHSCVYNIYVLLEAGWLNEINIYFWRVVKPRTCASHQMYNMKHTIIKSNI